MKKTTLYILVPLIFLGTFALRDGTRSMTDIKGPVFAVGTLVLGVVAAWRLLSGTPPGFLSRLGPFAAAAAAYLAFTAASALWASHSWIVKYAFADRALMLVLALSTAVVAAEARSWRSVAIGYAALGGVAAVFSLIWHGVYVPYYAHYAQFRQPETPIWPLAWTILSDMKGPMWRYVWSGLSDMKAPLGNANLLAALLILPMGMSVGLAFEEWRGRRRARVLGVLAVTLFLTLAVFVLCRSKSYWIGLYAGAAVFAALRARRWYWAAAIAVVVASALGVHVWEKGYVERVRESKSYIVRAELWRRAVLMAEVRPALGWGAGNFFTDNQPFAGEAAMRVVRYYEGGAEKNEPIYKVPAPADMSVHNEYLEELAEGGAAGLILYLVLLAAALYSAIRARRLGFAEPLLLDAAISIFAVYLVTNSMNPEVHFADFAPHFWILTGLLVAAYLRAGGQAARGASARSRSPLESPLKLAVVAACACAAAFGCYTFAFADFRSSLDYSVGDRLYSAREFGPAARAYLSTANDTWDPLLRVRALYLAGWSCKYAGDASGSDGAFRLLSGEVAALLDTDYIVGQRCEAAGDYKGALFYYTRHGMGHANDARVPARIALLRALLAVEGGSAGEGTSEAKAYFAAHPDDKAGRREYVRALLRLGSAGLGEVEANLKALAPGGSSAEDIFLAGRAAIVRNDLPAAVDLFKKAIASGYRSEDVYYYLAGSLKDLGKLSEALAVADEGRAALPSSRNLAELRASLAVAGVAPGAVR